MGNGCEEEGERMRIEGQPISSRIALYGGIFGFLRVELWCGVLLDVGGSYHFIGWGLFAVFITSGFGV